MTRPTVRHALAAGTLGALLVLAVEPVVALAQAGGNDAGKVGSNLGKILKSWAIPLFTGIAGLVALPLLAKRDVANAMVFALLALVVGAFVFAPGELRGFIGDFWETVLG